MHVPPTRGGEGNGNVEKVMGEREYGSIIYKSVGVGVGVGFLFLKACMNLRTYMDSFFLFQ